MSNELKIDFLKRLAKGIAEHFGENCEVVVHDLTNGNIESSIVAIENGHVTSRKVGDGPSHVVLEALRNKDAVLEDHLNYLMTTKDQKVIKSSTIYVYDESGQATNILSINYDMTALLMAAHTLTNLTKTEQGDKEPEPIVQNVNDLLDELLEQSVQLVGKPVALMNKEDKIKALQYLYDSGALLISKSGDKISKYFGISKYTLYNYIDVKK
ncbi:MAG: helix-turn-helix transcriptional regulator [Eubacteriales bacterium]|jgi:predicted transcriptional regulator YheO|nr:helix-turn-helix transcriptional regulator [Eubacteriales bacterium]